MIREITAMDARKKFGELLNEVKYRHDTVLIKKAGKPMAALIDVALFEKIKLMGLTFDAMTQELGTVYTQVDPCVAMGEIDEALADIRKK